MSHESAQPEVTSVPELDLQRYLGLWFEIARLPLKWEDTNATCITAVYSLWLLSRTADIDSAIVDEYLDAARAQGFDLTQLIRPVHDGRRVTDAVLESAK